MASMGQSPADRRAELENSDRARREIEKSKAKAKLPPPLDLSSRQKRAKNAEAALKAHTHRAHRGDPLDERISDLITDLFHLADMSGLDASQIWERAVVDFEAEKAEAIEQTKARLEKK